MRWVLALTILVAGCDAVFSLDRPPIDAPMADALDAPLDASPVFGTPELVTLECPTGQAPGDVTLDVVETIIVYTCTLGGDANIHEAPLMGVDRGGTSTTVVGTNANEGSPELSPDGKQLYYLTFTAANIGQINFSSRAALGMAWDDSTVPASLNTADDDRPGSPDAVGVNMVISRGGRLVELLWDGNQWIPLDNMGSLGAPTGAVNPHLSADGLTLVFAANGAGLDLFVARRTSPASEWKPAVPISELNTPNKEGDPWLSADGRRLYFARGGVVFVSRK